MKNYKTISYSTRYVDQTLIEEHITSNKNTHIAKSDTGSGLTFGIFKINGEEHIQNILLVVPTVALILDKYKEYTSDTKPFGKTNAAFWKGKKNGLVLNDRNQTLRDINSFNMIMSTPDQLEMLSSEQLQLLVDKKFRLVLDEIHLHQEHILFRPAETFLFQAVIPLFKKNFVKTITATPFENMVKDIKGFEQIYFENEIKEEREMYVIYNDLKLFNSYRAQSRNILNFDNHAKNHISLLDMNPETTQIGIEVGDSLKVKMYSYVNKSIQMDKDKGLPTIILASSSSMEGINIELEDGTTFISIILGKNDVNEFSYQNVIQAAGRIRDNNNPVMIHIDNSKYNSDKIVLESKLTETSNEYLKIIAKNFDFSAQLFNNFKKMEKLFKNEYKIKLIKLSDPVPITLGEGRKKYLLWEKMNNINSFYSSKRALVNVYTNLIENELSYRIGGEELGHYSFTLAMDYLMTAMFQDDFLHNLEQIKKITSKRRLYDVVYNNLMESGLVIDDRTKENKKLYQTSYIKLNFKKETHSYQLADRFKTLYNVQYIDVVKVKEFVEIEKAADKLNDIAIKEKMGSRINNLKRFCSLYYKSFDKDFLVLKGYREYSSVTAISIPFLTEFFPHSFIEIDISNAYPTFIDEFYGTNMADKVYQNIMDSFNIDRKKAKQKYNMMLNWSYKPEKKDWSKQEINQNRFDFFRRIGYKEGVAYQLVQTSQKHGQMFEHLTAAEELVMNQLRLDLGFPKDKIYYNDEKVFNKYDKFNKLYPGRFVRRHDSLLIFGSNEFLENIKNKFDGLESPIDGSMDVQFHIVHNEKKQVCLDTYENEWIITQEYNQADVFSLGAMGFKNVDGKWS